MKNKSKKRSFTGIITLQDKTKIYFIFRSIDGKFLNRREATAFVRKITELGIRDDLIDEIKNFVKVIRQKNLMRQNSKS